MNLVDRHSWISKNNICSLLRKYRDSQPDKTVFRFLNSRGREVDSCTYQDLDQHTNGLAAQLQSTDAVSHGMVAALLYPPGLDFIRAFLACVKSGAVPMPVPTPNLMGSRSDLDDLAHVLEDANASAVLCPGSFQQDMKGKIEADQGIVNGRTLSVLGEMRWIATDNPVQPLANFRSTDNELLFLQYTSGSTARPRGVMVSHANVIHNCGLCISHDNPVGVSWLPHYHDMGLIGSFLFTVVSGGECTFFSPLSFMRRPALWLEAISRYRATLTTAPDFAYAYCLREDKVPDAACREFDLRSMKVMINASEPIKASTYWEFLRRFEPFGLSRCAYVAGYGLAEHTLAVTLSNGTPDRIGSSPQNTLGCGIPKEDVTVAIVDPQTLQRVKNGQAGEIWLDSSSKALGYYRKETLTKKTFQARIAGESDDHLYLRTGDLGFLHEGELHVSGRLKDMLVIRGRNLFPSDIEERIEKAFPQTDAGSVAVFGVCEANRAEERLIVMIETRTGTQSPRLSDVIDLVSTCSAAPRITVIRAKTGSIIRTTSGKIARPRLAKRWSEGDLAALEKLEFEEPTVGDDSIEMVIGKIRQAAGDDQAATATLETLSLGSIDLVSLELWIEERISQSASSGTGLLEALVDLRILQEMKIVELDRLIAELQGGTVDGTDILTRLGGTFAELQTADSNQMQADVSLLSKAITPAGYQPDGGEACLVTGATGFLGAHLVRCLLETTTDPIFLLVRCRTAKAGRNRVIDALTDTGLAREMATRFTDNRITVLPGSLASDKLGLDDADWAGLSETVSRIYHSGAIVDYVKNYQALRGANVCGTSTLIELASQGCAKAMHFVSTTFTFGWTAADSLLEDGFNTSMSGLNFGYAQTKWVAESLMMRALDCGIDGKIYRPSLLTASGNGAFVEHDITIRVLGYMLRHGVYADIGNQISMVPVDICAANIVALSRNDQLAAKRFHITTDEHHTLTDICNTIAGNHGYRFRKLSLDGFIAHVNRHCTIGDPLFPLRPFINKNHGFLEGMSDKIYDNANYRAALPLSPGSIQTPELAEVIRPIMRFLQDRKLVPELHVC